MKLGDLLVRMHNLNNSDKIYQILAIFRKNLISQNYTGVDFFCKNDAWKLVFGLVVPLNSIY